MENHQYYNTTLLYKPHIDYHQCQPTTTQGSDHLLVNNNPPHTMNEYSSSSILSPYPLISDSNYSTWQDACPTDYLGLPTFDPKQQTSPSASPLSSTSSTSLDMPAHSSADDFCVSDLLDSYAQHQPLMASPALTDTTVTMVTHSACPTYFTQPSSMPQGVSPTTKYWISPETPLMESMDGLVATNPTNATMDYQHYQQQSYFFTKQDEGTTASSVFTNPPPFMFTMANPMHRSNGSPLPLGNKKKAKKVHHCPHCHHTSNRANNMKEHILTHDPYRPKLFACNICQKSFARKHDMKRHTKSHLRVPRKQSKLSQPHPQYLA